MKIFRLRKLNIKDAPYMNEWMHDEEIIKNLEKDFRNKTLNECEDFIVSSKNNKNHVHYAIVNKDDEYLGTVSLKNINFNDLCAEFAITIRRKALGTGCSIYAMKKIIDIQFKKYDLKYVYWYVNTNNVRAVRFYDKNSYKRVIFNEIVEKCNISKEIFNNNYIWYMIAKD